MPTYLSKLRIDIVEYRVYFVMILSVSCTNIFFVYLQLIKLFLSAIHLWFKYGLILSILTAFWQLFLFHASFV